MRSFQEGKAPPEGAVFYTGGSRIKEFKRGRSSERKGNPKNARKFLLPELLSSLMGRLHANSC